AVATDSSGVPSAIEKSPLDFADEAEASSVPDDVSDPDPLAFADAPSHPPVDVKKRLPWQMLLRQILAVRRKRKNAG
nr:hypothetical protein [Tanacetum cinerariifolium]